MQSSKTRWCAIKVNVLLLSVVLCCAAVQTLSYLWMQLSHLRAEKNKCVWLSWVFILTDESQLMLFIVLINSDAHCSMTAVRCVVTHTAVDFSFNHLHCFKLKRWLNLHRSIPHFRVFKRRLDPVLRTRVSLWCWVNGLSAWRGLWGKRLFGTVAPELQALLFVGEAHAVVAVGQSILTGGAVQQVDVGRTVRRGPSAVLWQVTRPRWAPAHGTCLLQLAQTGNKRWAGREGGAQDIWRYMKITFWSSESHRADWLWTLFRRWSKI